MSLARKSRQRRATDTTLLHTGSVSEDAGVAAIRRTIQQGNSKAKRTMSRKRAKPEKVKNASTSRKRAKATKTASPKKIVPMLDDDDDDDDDVATSVEKISSFAPTTTAAAASSSSSDEGVFTARKAIKHNRELYDVLVAAEKTSSSSSSSSGAGEQAKPSSTTVESVDDYDAQETHKNMQQFNQFILNQNTLFRGHTQEQESTTLKDGKVIMKHPTFNEHTRSWYEMMQELMQKTIFDANPLEDDQDSSSSSSSSSSTTKERAKKNAATSKGKKSASSLSSSSRRASEEGGLPKVPIIYKTALTAAFACDNGKIIQYLMTDLEPYWEKLLTETQRRAIQATPFYDLSDAHVCPPEHVDRMLVTPYGNFNECSNEQNCKARVLYQMERGLIGYRSPQEFKELSSKPMSNLFLTQRFCYICHLALIHMSTLHQQNRGASCSTVNTPFMSPANQVGGYHQRHMIPHPIFQRSDVDVQTPMVSIPKAGTQNSGGLVVPVRMWVKSEYTVCTAKPVQFLDEDGRLRKETRPGLVENVERFIQHDTNKPPVEPVNPYTHTRFIIERRFDTWEILRYEFVTHVSRDEFIEMANQPRIRSRGSTGAARLKERMKATDDVIILPIYWALSVLGTPRILDMMNRVCPAGMRQFPFHAIFHKDIRYTVQHLEDILEGGRIYLHYLGQRRALNFPVDGHTALSVFRDQLDQYEAADGDEHAAVAVQWAEFYRNRRYYLAYQLRDEVIRTLRVVYPNTTAYNDPCFHGRLEIVDEWNRRHYGALFPEDGQWFDHEIRPEQLDAICAEPVPAHYFASDADFVRVRTEIVERENPRKELADYYKARGCEDVADAFQCHLAFLEFDELRARFSMNNIPREVARQTIDPTLWPLIFRGQVPTDWFEHRYAELSSRYAIALACAFRISVARRIYDYERERYNVLCEYRTRAEQSFVVNDQAEGREDLLQATRVPAEKNEYLHRLTSFIYTHFALLERAHTADLSSDASFYERVPSTAENRFLTHYEDVEPFDCISVHEGDLPNLTYLVTCVNFVVNTHETSKSSDGGQPVLLDMFRKMYPRCCQSRSAPDKHVAACEQNVSYLDTVRNAYRMTLMGGYRHVKQPPSFRTALRVYNETSLTGYNRQAFLEKQRNYPHLFLLCMTEMLIFFTREAPAYRLFILQNYPTYALYEDSVLYKADLVRRMHNEMSLEEIETFIAGLEIFINDDPTIATRSEFHVFRPLRVDPIKKLVTLIGNINNIRHRQGYYRPEMPPLLQRAIIQTVYSLPPNRNTDIIELMLRMNRFYPGPTKPPDWQQNVKRCSVYIILWVLDMMECAVADHVIETALNYMPPTDWEIFDLLINTMAVHFSVNVLRLPRSIGEQQHQALCRRFPGPEIDRDAGSICFSMCCQLKTSYDTTCDNTSPHLFFGQRKAFYRPYTGQIMCARRRRATTDRKHIRASKNQYAQFQAVFSLGDADQIVKVCQDMAKSTPEWQKHRRYRYQPECGEEPIAQYFPLAGHVIQYTTPQGVTDAYSVCTSCGATAGFSRRLFDVNGFTCISCEAAMVIKLYTPRCVACHCFINIHSGQGEGTGRRKWRRFVAFNDSMNLTTYRYEVFYVCASNGCYDLQTAKLAGEHVFANPHAMSTTSDLQRGRRVSAWKPELEIRLGNANVHDDIQYYYQNLTLPNKRRSDARRKSTTVTPASIVAPTKPEPYLNRRVLARIKKMQR